MFVVDGIAYAGEPKQDIRVRTVRVVNELSLLVTFESGEVRVFDCLPLLVYPVFNKLSDPAVFETVNVEFGVIVWLDGELDIASEKVYELSYPYQVRQVI